MRTINWYGVNWEHNDATIGRELWVTREAVRQMRRKLNRGKSPYWHRSGDSLEVKLSRMATMNMTAVEIAGKTGHDVAYVNQILKATGKPYRHEDRRYQNRKYEWDKVSRVEWMTLPLVEIAKRVGVKNMAIVYQRKARELKRMAGVKGWKE